MQLSWDNIQANAITFSKKWKGAGNEKSEAQSFVMAFLRVFTLDDLDPKNNEYEVPFTGTKKG